MDNQTAAPGDALEIAVQALRDIALGVELAAIGKGRFDPSVRADKALVAIRDLEPAAPAAAPADARRALLDIIDVIEGLDEPGPEADWIRALAGYGLGEGPHPDSDAAAQPAPGTVDEPYRAYTEEDM